MEELSFKVAMEGGSLRALMLRPLLGVERDAPSLVFMHEGLGSIGQWRDFPHRLALATGLRALVFDRPGFGESDPLQKAPDGRYLQREDLTSIHAVLESCHISSPILIGHSDGATLALLYAARYPERPLAVISEAAHVFVEDLTLSGIKGAEQAYNEGPLRKGLARYHRGQTEQMFRRWVDDWLSPEFSRWNIEERLESIRCPLLVIQGEDDPYGSLVQVESVVRRVSGPVQSRIVSGCGHVPHQQAEGEVLEAMSRFIKELLVAVISNENDTL